MPARWQQRRTLGTLYDLAKRFIQFLCKEAKEQTFFVFTNNCIEQCIHRFVPAFCNIAGIFIIPSSQKVLAFGQANIKPVSTSIAAVKLYPLFLKYSHCTSARIHFPEMGLWKVLIFGSYVIHL